MKIKLPFQKKQNGAINKLLNKEEKIYFIRRLYELIKHGYMLEDSIEFLMIQYNASQTIIKSLKEDLARGKKLSDILKQLDYSEAVISKMEFAEYYGKIENMLLEIEKNLLLEKEQKEKIIKTIRYPLFLTTSLIFLILLFNSLVIPQFQHIYNSSNINMDIQVKILIKILYYLPQLLTISIGLVVIFSLYLFYIYGRNKERFLQVVMKTPLLNRYFILFISHQYALEISLFLSSGFSIKTCLAEIISKNYNLFFKIISKIIENDLIQGRSFENAVLNVPYLDQSMAKFISHGRKNSMLDKELKLYSDIMLDTFIKLIDNRLKKIQPILFLFLSLIIIGLYLVILLPVFNMTSALK